MNKYFLYTARFALLLLFQVLILNNVLIGGYINPFIYVLFIMLLPFNIRPWLLLLIGFLLGYTVDIFSSTSGLHAGATVLLAFVRPTIVRLTTGARYPEGNHDPSISDMGARWFFTYSIVLVLIHHTALFFLEVFSFTQLPSTLLRILLSTLFSELLIMMIMLFFGKNRR